MAVQNLRRNVSYALSDPLLNVFPAPIVSNRAPTANDKSQIGQTWVDSATNASYTLTSIVGNVANWAVSSSGGGGVNQVNADVGFAVPAANQMAMAGGTNISTSGAGDTITFDLANTLSVSGSITAGTGLIATTGGVTASAGNITATLGSVSAGTTVTAGTGITTTTGNITATVGNIVATNGDILASAGNLSVSGSVSAGTTVTAGTGITATTGNVTVSTGSVQVALGDVDALAGAVNAATLLTAGTGLTVSAFGVGVVQTDALGVFSSTAGNDGEILIGNSVGSPVWATITAGSNISVANGANTITISSSGASTVAYTPVAASPYVVLAADYFIGVDTTGGPITIELPDAPTTGRVIVIKDSVGNSSVNAISVTTVGGIVTIDGAVSQPITSDFGSLQVIFNGTSYEIY